MGAVQDMRGRGPMRLFTPCLHLSTIYDLPIDWLLERRIRAIISDLDNTLVPWRDYRVADELAKWFHSLHAAGFRTVILTNARPSPTVEKMAGLLRTELVPGARKPVGAFFRRALAKVGATPWQACVIGDQVFTDILGGNLVGCHTVLVDRIGKREFAGTRFMRIFEAMALRILRRRGLLREAAPRGDGAGPAPEDRPGSPGTAP